MMASKQVSLPELKTLLTGLAMGESPRWHEDRLWFSDWGAQEIVAADLDGNSEVVVRTPFGLPFCIDWSPDGRLLIVSGRESLLLRREPDGSLVPHADLRGLSDKVWNEIVVDGLRQRRLRNHRSGYSRSLGSTGSRWHRLSEWHGRDARQFN